MDKKDIGRRVQTLRKRRGLTMRELAGRTGLSQGQVSRLENGRQGFRSATLMRVAEALGVRPYHLYLPKVEGEPGGARPEGARLPVALRGALRQPDFVALIESMAKAYREEPSRFRAIESVVRIILEGAGSGSG
jgi:transcriptional regulator with XRE-family HTH domain